MQTLVQQFQQATGMPMLGSQLLFALLILFLAYLCMRLGGHLIHRFAMNQPALQKKGRFRTIYLLLYHVFRVVVCFFALTLALDIFGINTTSVLTAAGIGGIAIAFGAQNVVNDIISGALMLLDNTINVGDYVALNTDVVGEVKEIQLRHTIIQGYTGMRYIVPNSKVQIIANYGRGPLQADVAVDFPYAVSLQKMQSIVKKVEKRAETEHAGEYLKLPYLLGVTQAKAFTYTVSIGAQADMEHFWSAARTLRALVIDTMQKEGVYPAGDPELLVRKEGR